MNQRNYSQELESMLTTMECPKRLLLHCCCAPCSSYTLEYLNPYFDIILYFYNPNIEDETEYHKRKDELLRFIKEHPFERSIQVCDDDYEPQLFAEMAKGMELVPEGGSRCFRCYELRLQSAAKKAKELGVDYYCTTLSISPHKNANKLMEIGERLANQYGVPYLPSDFKKKNGYKRSIELSREYNLYRQDFCGCSFSKAERDRRNREKENQ